MFEILLELFFRKWMYLPPGHSSSIGEKWKERPRPDRILGSEVRS